MKAWELLSDKSKWTKRAFARGGNGEVVDARSEEATCWCTLGAIQRCYLAPGRARIKWMEMAQHLEQAPPIQRFGGIVADWNDAATYEEVVALLKELDI